MIWNQILRGDSVLALRSWLPPLRRSRPDRKAAQKKLRTYRPQLESLEERVLMAGNLSASPAPLFGPLTTTGVGSTPDSAATIELASGAKAILAANFNSTNLSVLKSLGNGSFQHLVNLPTGSGPNGFAVGDFNHDSIQDFAVGNFNSNTLSVYLGQSNDTFLAGANVATAAAPANTTAVGDFDDDGNLDLATANFNSSTVSVALGNGDGTFQSVVDYTAGPGAISVATGDFNDDGKLDLATANYSGNSVSVLLNSGTGTFASPVSYAAGGNPWYIDAGDLDGDGVADLASANFGGGVTVLLANGDGTFQAGTTLGAGANPTGVEIGDINGDKIPDLVTSNYGSNDASVLLGLGNGAFQSAVSFGAGYGPNGLALGDFNNDGKLDVAVADQNGNTVGTLLNQSLQAVEGNPFTGILAIVADTTGTATTANLSASINWGDGQTTQVGSSAFASTGSGTFSLTGTYTYEDEGTYTVNITVFHTNGDSATTSTTVVVQDAPLTIQALPTLLAPAPGSPVAVGQVPDAVLAAQLDSLGTPYLLAANFDDGTLSVLRGSTTGTVQVIGTYQVGTGPSSLATGDFNNDGNLDVAVSNLTSNTVSVLLGSGDGTLANSVSFATGNAPSGLSVGNLAGPSSSAPSAEVSTAPNVGTDTVWVEDGTPAGASLFSDGGDSWTWVASNPTPFSDTQAHQSNTASGEHQHYFTGATNTLSIGLGDKLFTYVYLDPTDTPTEVMLQWHSTSEGWNHRAYWGANSINWGTDGTNSRRFMGALPTAGGWVRLEVDASLVGLEGKTLDGMAFTLYDGKATWDKAGVVEALPATPPGLALSGAGDGQVTLTWTKSYGATSYNIYRSTTLGGQGTTPYATGVTASSFNDTGVSNGTDYYYTVAAVTPAGESDQSNEIAATPASVNDTVWIEDTAPAGANLQSDGGDSWTWVESTLLSGSQAHQSNIASGEHQHYFTGATNTLSIATGDSLFAYVYLDPANTPSEVMLQWHDTTGSWDHRAYWGTNSIGWGTDGTASRRYMGELPAAGGWVRLEVPASVVGLEGFTVDGMAFTLFDGRATWDYAGKGSNTPAPSTPGVAAAPGDGQVTVRWTASVGATSYDIYRSPGGQGNTPYQLGVTGTSFTDTDVTNGTTYYYQVVATKPSNEAALVVANTADDTIGVLPSNGDGTFGAMQTYAVGDGPSGTALGDFNGDGKLDIAASNATAGTISVLLNNGAGSFATPATYSAGAGATGIVATDLNGDNHLDLVVANAGNDSVAVLLGNANGTFQTAVTYAVGANPASVAVSDINGDDIPDLLTSNLGSDDISVLLGNGSGVFGNAVSFAAGSSPMSLTTDDLNGDGRTDVAIANQGSNNVTVLLNQSLQAVVGQLFSGVLASFTDGNPLATTADYTATIHWGDGNTTQVGPEAFANSQGGFNLAAGHVYNSVGTYSGSILIVDDDGSTATTTFTVGVHAPQYGAITGVEFKDRNADGKQQTDEAPLPGQTVELVNSSGQVVDSTQTGSDGSYSFSNVTPGTYTVQTSQDGWTQTGPGTVFVRNGSTPTANLGSFQNVRISGWKFSDLNGNGVYESSEPRLSGWTVELYTLTDGQLSTSPVQTATTDDHGEYTFEDLGPGTYVVKEVLQAGWEQTSPASGTPSTYQFSDGSRGYVVTAISGVSIRLANGQTTVLGDGTGSVTLNGLTNSSITGTITFDDGQGHTGSPTVYLSQFIVTLQLQGESATFYTYCIDPAHQVSIGQTYAVYVGANMAPAYNNASQMAYIYQKYGTQNLADNPLQAAAVAVAELDLALNNQPTPTYFVSDGNGGYSSGTPSVFRVTGISQELADLVNQYIVEANGAVTTGAWLDASAQGDYQNRGQSLLLPESRFIFGNLPAPTAVDDSYTMVHDRTLTVAATGILANDINNNTNTLTSILDVGPSHGNLALNADGSFTYTPNTHFVGIDSFTYHANNQLDSNLATVTINVVNHRPSPVKQSVVTNEETPLDITVQGTDPDNDTLTYSIFRGPQHGTVTLVGNVATYTPDSFFVGADEFTFQANDGILSSNLGVVRVAVVGAPVELPPDEEPPPSDDPVNIPLEVFAGSPLSVRVGELVNFQAIINDPQGVLDIALVEWDFDYDFTEFNADVSGLSQTPSFTYDIAGTYAVALSVLDASGNESFDVTFVDVADIAELVVIAGADRDEAVGATVTFSGTALAPAGATIVNRVWDFDFDGETFTVDAADTLTPEHVFDQAGTYQVAFQVADSDGNSDLSTLTVSVGDYWVGPTANAGSDLSINEGETAFFTGSYTDPDGVVVDVAWDFDFDGLEFDADVTGTLNPPFAFPTPRMYEVALRVTDDNGLVDISVLQVVVLNSPPTADAGADRICDVGETLTFTGTASDAGGPTAIAAVAWDFNYDGVVFKPSDNVSSARHTFIGPGTYTVAFQAVDVDGETSLDTLTVTVNDVETLVVDAGPDQEVDEGNSVVFDGKYVALSLVDAAFIDWDFDYDGNTFEDDPLAHGTLTPDHEYAQPGEFQAALRITDSNNVTRIGTLDVTVFNVLPSVDLGDDQVLQAGQTAQFVASIDSPVGPSDVVAVEWDFDYDFETFEADAAFSGQTAAFHAYYQAGFYDVAVRVTDSSGEMVFDFVTVEVVNVPPSATATVSNSGQTSEGAPVVFTFSNLSDPDPSTQFAYSADFFGDGEFQVIDEEALTTHPDGSVSFDFRYDDNGTYQAVLRIEDEAGEFTDFVQTVTVANVAPTAELAPASGSILQAGDPIEFINVFDPSDADTDELNYFFRVGTSGDFVIGEDAYFYLEDYPAGETFTIQAYVQDKDGDASPLYSTTVTVFASTAVRNTGSGSIRIDWSGSSGPLVLGPNQTHAFGANIDGLTIALLTAGADYDIVTNDSIDVVTYDPGVGSFDLTVTTGFALDMPDLIGAGDIGSIFLPGGSELAPVTVSVYARGNLGGIYAPDDPGTLYVQAGSIFFDDLTGSIVGFEHIDNLKARGNLGTDPAQQVWANAGIGSLSAYSIGATVDTNRTSSLPVSAVVVGAGGVTGSLAGSLYRLERDADGNVISYLDPLLNHTTITRDANGNPQTTTDALGATIQQVYSATGKLTFEINRNGLQRTLQYDADDRLIEETWRADNGTTVLETTTFTYDTNGQILTATNSAGTYTFTYRSDGLQETQTDPHGVTLTFGYDSAGRINSVADSLGGLLTSAYDDQDYLTQRTYSGPNGAEWRIDIGYSADRLSSTETRYADLAGTQITGVTDYVFDRTAFTQAVQQRDGQGAIVADYLYQYDRVTRRLSAVTLNGVTTQYTYDAAGQLTSDGANTYSYDMAGNRTLPGYVTGADNRLLADGVWSYQYDGEGNVVGKTSLTTLEAWTFAYDNANRLQVAQHFDAAGLLDRQVEYQYDAFGHRLAQVVTTYAVPGNLASAAAVATRFAYSGDDVWADLDATGSLQTRYLRGNALDKLFGQVDAAGQVTGYLTDTLGSVRDLTDPLGNVIGHADYDGFGNLVGGGALGRYGFGGREFDVETGLYHSINGRNYDPQVGRWLSQDGQRFHGGDFNLYRFASNDPINRKDAYGESIWGKLGNSEAAFEALRKLLRNLAVVARGDKGLEGFPTKFTAGEESIVTQVIYRTLGNLDLYIIKKVSTTFALVDNFQQIPEFTRNHIWNYLLKSNLPERNVLLQLMLAGEQATPRIEVSLGATPGSLNLITYHFDEQLVNAENSPIGAFLADNVDPFLQQVDQMKENYPKLIALLKDIFAEGQDKFEKLRSAFIKDPDGIVTRLVGGLADGLGKFLSADNFNHITDAVSSWLFGGLGERLKGLTFPTTVNADTVTTFLGQVILKVTDAEKIDFAYLKQVLSDVTGLDADSLIASSESLKELFAEPDFFKAVVTKLDGFAKGMFDNFVAQAQDVVINQLFPKALVTVGSKLNPLVGGLSSIFNGLNFLLSGDTQTQIKAVMKKLFDSVDTIINGSKEDVGDKVLGILNDKNTIGFALNFASSQLIGSDFPGIVQNFVKKLELPPYIQKGVENLWNKIESKVPGTVKGAAITDNFPVGDPWQVRGVTKKNANGTIGAEVTIDGDPLVARLQSWLALKPDLAADVQPLINATTTVQSSEAFQAVLKAMADVVTARKAGKPTAPAVELVRSARVTATIYAKNQLQGKLNELLKKLVSGLPSVKPLGVTKVTFDGATVERSNGVKAVLTGSSIRPPNQHAAFNEPSWWKALKAANPNFKWEKGHLLGSKLGGTGGSDYANLVPLIESVNAPVMYDFERIIEQAITGKFGLPMRINYSAIPTYPDDDSLIPTSIRLKAFSYGDDGKSFAMDVTIYNEIGRAPTVHMRRGGWTVPASVP